VLSVEDMHFLSDVVCVGTFRCAPDHRLFANPGAARNHVFVFPRQPIVIERETHPPFVAGPNVIPLYNAGQFYRRQAFDPSAGVHSDWFGVAPDVVLDVARRYRPGLGERPDLPFAIPFVPSPPDLFARQRRLFDAVKAGATDRVHIEESVVSLLASVLQLAATKPPRPTRERSRQRQYVEDAKALLAVTLDKQLSLREIAADCGLSVFHLCKVFRKETGFTVHEYRLELRLRRALDEVLSSRDLLQTALELGFNSHSHFTYAFRKAFGLTPSELRRRGRLPPCGTVG
jgi:AraC family transcriptional regulator